MALFAFAFAGPPVFEYRARLLGRACSISRWPASVLCFSLYFPVVRQIGPAKAAYSSVLVPIIAMGFSTAFEGYRWTPLAVAGRGARARRNALALLSRSRLRL